MPQRPWRTGQEWGTATEDPDLFAPTALDTDQWARTLRDSGFTLAVLVVTHHDGFVLYPSRYTGHSVNLFTPVTEQAIARFSH